MEIKLDTIPKPNPVYPSNIEISYYGRDEVWLKIPNLTFAISINSEQFFQMVELMKVAKK